VSEKMSYLFEVLFGFFGWLYFRLIHRRQVKVIGKENIPQGNRILFYSNHPTMIDPLLILISGFFPQMVFKPNCLPLVPAAAENFLSPDCRKVPVIRKIPFIRDLPLMKWVLVHFCIPVKPGRKDPQTLKQSITKMKKGKSILIFPEGHRTKGEELDEFQMGIASLCYFSQPSAVIPINIIGAEKILPIRGQWPDWSKGKIFLLFGHSISQKLDQIKKEEKNSSKKLIYPRIIKLMREELLKLKP